MSDVTVNLGDTGAHRHDWAPTGPPDPETGVTPLHCACGAGGAGLGDFSDEARALRAHPQGGEPSSWRPSGPVLIGEPHGIVDQHGNESTCDCQTLPADHSNFAQHGAGS